MTKAEKTSKEPRGKKDDDGPTIDQLPREAELFRMRSFGQSLADHLKQAAPRGDGRESTQFGADEREMLRRTAAADDALKEFDFVTERTSAPSHERFAIERCDCPPRQSRFPATSFFSWTTLFPKVAAHDKSDFLGWRRNFDRLAWVDRGDEIGRAQLGMRWSVPLPKDSSQFAWFLNQGSWLYPRGKMKVKFGWGAVGHWFSAARLRVGLHTVARVVTPGSGLKTWSWRHQPLLNVNNGGAGTYDQYVAIPNFSGFFSAITGGARFDFETILEVEMTARQSAVWIDLDSFHLPVFFPTGPDVATRALHVDD